MDEEQPCFIDGCQQDWDRLPTPDGPLTVGIDGGYVRGRHKEGHFEVIAGKEHLGFPARPRRTGIRRRQMLCLRADLRSKQKRRLFELLRSQGMQPNQQVVFLSDGGEDVVTSSCT
jgi:hypothetical protein